MKLRNEGHWMVEKGEETHHKFSENLQAYGGEWFWNHMLVLEGMEWILESMRKGTLTCVTDESYMSHVNKNVTRAGWIVQDMLIGKNVSRPLAE